MKKSSKQSKNAQQKQKNLIIEQIRKIDEHQQQEEAFQNQFQLQKQELLYNISSLQSQLSSQQILNFNFKTKNELDQMMVQKSSMVIKDQIQHLQYSQQNTQLQEFIDFHSYLMKQNSEIDNQQLMTQIEIQNEVFYSFQQQQAQKNQNLELKIDQQKQLTELRNVFESEINEYKIKFDIETGKLRDELDNFQSEQIRLLEQAKESKMNQLVESNNQKYKEIKLFYNDIISSNLALIKQLKSEINVAEETEEGIKRQINRFNILEQSIRKPLDTNMKEIEELMKQKDQWVSIRAKKDQFRESILEIESQIAEQEYQYEIKFQSLSYLKREYQNLKQNEQKLSIDIFQKSGLLGLILEKQIGLMEVKQQQGISQLQAIQESKVLDIGEKLTKIQSQMDQENAMIKDKINSIRKNHIQMVQSFNNLLKENDIRVENKGFICRLPKIQIQQIVIQSISALQLMKLENYQKINLIKHNLFFLVNNKRKLLYQVFILTNVFCTFLTVYYISQGEYYRFENKSISGFMNFILDDQIVQKRNGKLIIANWISFKTIIDKLQGRIQDLKNDQIADLETEDIKVTLNYFDTEQNKQKILS